MRSPFLKLQYYATYGYASAVRSILSDQFAYIRGLDDFYGDERYLGLVAPFQRRSAFHWFIQFVIESIVRDEFSQVDLDQRKRDLAAFATIPAALQDIRPTLIPADEALSVHGIEYPTFAAWLRENGKSFAQADDIDLEAFHEELYEGEEFERLINQFTEEVFFVLFQNRHLLLLFNDMIARQVSETDLGTIESEYRRFFFRNGVLKRVHIPEWVRRAVFFRDRGRCLQCQSDISGTLSIANTKHFDHIVPLADGGLNDVSNIQLLCESCNLTKSDSNAATSNEYEGWYPMDGS